MEDEGREHIMLTGEELQSDKKESLKTKLNDLVEINNENRDLTNVVLILIDILYNSLFNFVIESNIRLLPNPNNAEIIFNFHLKLFSFSIFFYDEFNGTRLNMLL